jgi:DNA invertase Pin-like site-specific DNA recombinase
VNNPAANKLTLHILAAEAEAISARTKAALADYKARGGKLGGQLRQCRYLTQEAGERGAQAAAVSIRAKADAAYADLAPTLHKLRNDGLSHHAIAAELNRMGHSTRRGKPWNQVQVGRVFKRYSC